MKTIAITGVLGYSGRYIAAEAKRRGWRVVGLTNSAGRLPNEAGYELRPMPWSTQEDVLAGVDVLVNTYWVRFSYSGSGHAAFSHDEAVRNTKQLFDAAKRAGVKRVVHTSITHPDAASELPYFRGKAELEAALAASGIPHSILRPAILFGDTPAESILINNMAWCLRHLPAVATFGRGQYRMQPIHVQDYAELAMDEAESAGQHRVVDAVGVEVYTFRDMWKQLARSMNLWRPVLPVPAGVGYLAARVLGALVGDVMLTRDEIAGLSQNRLAVTGAGVGKRRLSDWVQLHASTLGRQYASELARRK
ncbi:MAG: NAD(P)H-binding protein [Akkermansia sp.]|nr:NAD(P)H-binding protein [Akkermansia sp.]